MKRVTFKIINAIVLILFIVNAGFSQINPEPIVSVKINTKEINKIIAESASEIAIAMQDLDYEFYFDFNNKINSNKLTEERVKTISKLFPITAQTRLSIINKFGDVTVNTWDRNEFKIEITIKAFEETGSKAEELLKSITVLEEKTNTAIKLSTEINMKQQNWNTWKDKNGKRRGRGVEINYIINMPANNFVEIANSFGAISMVNHSGPVNINSKYGEFKANNLTSKHNNIIIAYGSGQINFAEQANMDVSYSKLGLVKVKDLTLNHKYGKLEIGEVDKIKAEISYSGGNINKLNETGQIILRYSGGINTVVGPNLKSLEIESSYSEVRLKPLNANFNFDVTVSYAGFDYSKTSGAFVTSTLSESNSKQSTTKKYKGRVGSESKNSVIINSKFGKVIFL